MNDLQMFLRDLREQGVVDDLLDQYEHRLTHKCTPLWDDTDTTYTGEVGDDTNGVLWWGGWGGAVCGWSRPDCFGVMARKDWEESGLTEEMSLINYIDRLIGEGVWPREMHDLGDHAEEVAYRCDECDRPVADIITDAFERLSGRESRHN